MEQLQIDGQPIGYEIFGKGKPVLLLHGFCEDRSIWNEFLAPMEEESYQFILADLPGFGDSPLVESLSIEKMGKILLGFMEALGHDTFILVGHSLGGYVSLAMAEQQGSRITGLVMFHSHPFADTDDLKARRTKGMEFIKQNGHELYVKQLFNDLFYPLYISSHRYVLDRLTYHASNLDTSGIINALEAMRERPDRAAVLENIQCPVQFIIGAEEKIIPKEFSLEQTHLPAVASINILAKSNHMGMFEVPKEARRILKSFFETLSD